MVPVTPDPVLPADPAAGGHFSALLSALVEATHPRTEIGAAFADALHALVRLVEADAGVRLVNGQKTRPSDVSPLADPGIRNLITGLLDIASYTTGRGEEFRDLRELLQSFESAPGSMDDRSTMSDSTEVFPSQSEKTTLSV